MLRFVLLGLTAVFMGLTGGWIVPAETPVTSSSRAPINIVSAHTFRTPPLASPTPTATAEVPEATSEPSGSGHVARKRKQLKTRVAAAASTKSGLRAARCGDDDDDDEEC
jgi:hypothetical protein